MLRWPSVKISGRELLRPTNGLSGGTVPSSFRRSTLPARLMRILRRRAGGIGVADGRVAVADRHVDMPSLPNAIRDALPDGIAEKRSLHLDERRAIPSSRARA